MRSVPHVFKRDVYLWSDQNSIRYAGQLDQVFHGALVAIAEGARGDSEMGKATLTWYDCLKFSGFLFKATEQPGFVLHPLSS